MTDPYSLLLAAALGAASLAAITAVAAPLVTRRRRPLAIAATAAAAAALALDAAAVAVHWRTGHGPGAGAPMGAAGFIAEHPAFGLVAAVALAVLAATRRRPR